MRTVAVIAIGTLTLAGCDKAPDQPKTVEEVAASAEKLVKPKPGLYESTFELLEYDVPGVSPKQAEMMRDATIGQQPANSRQCLTQAQADEGFKRVARRLGEGAKGVKCTFSRFDASGNKLAATLACDAPMGIKVNTDLDGTVREDGSTLTMTTQQKSPLLPGGEMNMKMRITSERIGDCKN